MTSEPGTFVGIEVSTARLDVAGHEAPSPWRAENRDEGITELVHPWKSLPPTLLVWEAPGGFELRLVAELAAARWPVVVTHPRQVRHFARSLGRLAKTDRRDAQLLAQFGAVLRPAPRPLPTEQEEHLTALLTRRRQVVDLLTVETNRLHPVRPSRRPDGDEHSTWLKQKLAKLDAESDPFLQGSPRWQAKDELLQSVPGSGRITASTRLALLPELGTLHRQEMAALVGGAPVHRDSGRTQGKRRIFGGRAPLRTVFYMAALSAKKHNPTIRRCSEQLLERGKEKKVALVACLRKLLVILKAMLRSGPAWQSAPA